MFDKGVLTIQHWIDKALDAAAAAAIDRQETLKQTAENKLVAKLMERTETDINTRVLSKFGAGKVEALDAAALASSADTKLYKVFQLVTTLSASERFALRGQSNVMQSGITTRSSTLTAAIVLLLLVMVGALTVSTKIPLAQNVMVFLERSAASAYQFFSLKLAVNDQTESTSTENGKFRVSLHFRKSDTASEGFAQDAYRLLTQAGFQVDQPSPDSRGVQIEGFRVDWFQDPHGPKDAVEKARSAAERVAAILNKAKERPQAWSDFAPNMEASWPQGASTDQARRLGVWF
jgi:hypothetical protein